MAPATFILDCAQLLSLNPVVPGFDRSACEPVAAIAITSSHEAR